MGAPRRAARTDANQGEIVSVLERCGCLVQSLSSVGDGVPDLLVFQQSRKWLFLVEVKDGSRKPSERRLTDEQVRWHAKWASAPLYVVESVDDALELLK